MIDTNVKHVPLTFKNDMTAEFPEPVLPEGFVFENYKGDEEGKRIWSEILCTVGFHGGDVEKGIECFNHEFGAKIDLATKRMFFIKAPDGKYVGTCTAWETPELERGTLHWLGVNPDYQKYGLGRALVEKCLYTFKTQLPGLPAYLSTNTTCHKAMCLYIKKHFYPVYWHEESKQQFNEAVEALKGHMREAEYVRFVEEVQDDSAKEERFKKMREERERAAQQNN